MTTFRKHPYIQAAFERGYASDPESDNPFLWSSPVWEAFELGRFFRAEKLPCSLVAPSRGHSFRTAQGGVYRLTYGGPIVTVAEVVSPAKPEPKLLAALDSLLSHIEEDVPLESVSRHFRDAVDDARLAIAKAKGGAQ